MTSQKIGPTGTALVVEPTRKRETPPPERTFRKVLEGSARVLLAGAKVATSIVAGPVVAAAIPSLSGGALAGSTGLTTDGTGLTTDGTGLGMDGAGGADILSGLQQQKVSDDLKLLALQDQIQRHNRQITLVSNVMKARHETAKSAIGNIRS